MSGKADSNITVRMGEGRRRIVRYVQASRGAATLSERFAQIRRRAAALQRERSKQPAVVVYVPRVTVQQSQRPQLQVDRPKSNGRLEVRKSPGGRQRFLDVQPKSSKYQAMEASYKRGDAGKRSSGSPRVRGGGRDQKDQAQRGPKQQAKKQTARAPYRKAASQAAAAPGGKKNGPAKAGAGAGAKPKGKESKKQEKGADLGLSKSVDPASLDYEMDRYRHQAGRGPDPDQARLDRELEGYRAGRKGKGSAAAEGST